MIRRDYLLRMIEMIGQMLARIRERSVAGEVGEARVILDQAFQEIIGAGPEAVGELTETELFARLTVDSPTQVLREKSLLLVALLEEAARLHDLAKRETESRACRLKALNLLLTLQLQDYNFEMPAFVPRIEGLRRDLGETPLPLRTLAGLWRHYERLGGFAAAEDALYELIEAGPVTPALLAEGRAFYERLLRESDAALESGSLPRAEVEAGLAELRKLSAQAGAES